jgi:hypothetical protein
MKNILYWIANLPTRKGDTKLEGVKYCLVLFSEAYV